MDSKTVIYYIDKQGGTKSMPLLQVVPEVFHWAQGHVTALTTGYLPKTP